VLPGRQQRVVLATEDVSIAVLTVVMDRSAVVTTNTRSQPTAVRVQVILPIQTSLHRSVFLSPPKAAGVFIVVPSSDVVVLLARHL